MASSEGRAVPGCEAERWGRPAPGKNGAGAVFSKLVPVSSQGTGQELPLPGMAIWKSSYTPIRVDQYKCVSGGEVIW